MAVYVPPHPLVKHFMSIARNKDTPSAAFRSAMAELGRLLLYECAKDLLQTVDFEVETPCGVAEATFVDPSKPVTVVPVLRAGLVLVEQAHLVFPISRTCHLGYVRDEETLEASMYLDKLPKQFTSDDLVVIADPMVATGGTAINAVRDVLDRGADIKNVRLVCAVCTPPALTKLGEEFPELIMYSAMIDPELNDKGYIVPGLGDAGDRAYGTE